jgi:hypothetical protein
MLGIIKYFFRRTSARQHPAAEVKPAPVVKVSTEACHANVERRFGSEEAAKRPPREHLLPPDVIEAWKSVYARIREPQVTQFVTLTRLNIEIEKPKITKMADPPPNEPLNQRHYGSRCDSDPRFGCNSNHSVPSIGTVQGPKFNPHKSLQQHLTWNLSRRARQCPDNLHQRVR